MKIIQPFYIFEGLLKPRDLKDRKERAYVNRAKLVEQTTIDGDFTIDEQLIEYIKKYNITPKVELITGNLYVHDVKHFPEWVSRIKVGEDFSSAAGKLVSLENSPRHVGADYFIRNVKGFANMPSLEGCTREIGANLCIINCGITSCKGCPDIINGDLMLNSNNLVSLEGIATTVRRNLDVSNNKLVTLRDLPDEIGASLMVYNNKNVFGRFDIPSGITLKGNVYFTKEDYDKHYYSRK